MARDGTDGFDDFAVAAWPRLRHAAYLLCGDAHLAEDLTQATLERTYAAWRRVRREDATAYARRVLVNLNVDRHRRRRGVREIGGEQADREMDRPRPESGDPVADRDEIVRLLAGLTDRERRIVLLRHYYDLSEARVASELGVSKGTVKSALSRALAKLRVEVDHELGDRRPTEAEEARR